MAALDLGTTYTPARQPISGQTVKRRHISGTGTAATTIVAVATGKKHIVIGGRLSASGPDSVAITSDANARDTLQFPAATTLTFPVGVETVGGEALKLTKAGGTTVDGWLDYITVKDGEYVHIPA